MSQIPFVYVLYSGKLYGTERMTIKTVKAMSAMGSSVILTPPGLILKEAAQQSIAVKTFDSYWDSIYCLKSYLVEHQKLVFITTSISQSISIVLCNFFYRRQVVHLHMVHGGTEEHLSYARKFLLNNLPVKLIAVSNYVRERLEAYRVHPQKITVIENFLLKSEIELIPKRKPFKKPGIGRVVIVSRLDPIKRIDLLFDALDSFPELNNLEFRIFGFGRDMDKFKTKISKNNYQVTLNGFSENIWQAMADCDLLLHLCPVEPFGLAILEAMAVGLPVLVPDRGGTKTLVANGVSGFYFNADDKIDLAFRLSELRQVSPELLNNVVRNARQHLLSQYSEEKGIAAYRQLFDSS